MNSVNFPFLETWSVAFELEGLKRLNSEELSKEYEQKKKEYTIIKIVPTPYWGNFRKQILKSLDDEYTIKLLSVKAYGDPDVLVDNKFSKLCPEYINALTQNDTALLLSTWKEREEKHNKNNIDPEKAMERFYKKYNSEDRLLYARIDLVTFGWYNCVNAKVYRVKANEKQFTKIFTNIKCVCV